MSVVSSVSESVSSGVQRAKLALQSRPVVALRWLVLVSLYPFVWAHERTHYAAARPWRLKTSEMKTWTFNPHARILYDLEETPRWAMRLVGLAPMIVGYVVAGVVATVGVEVVFRLPYEALTHLVGGWVVYTVPSPSDVLLKTEVIEDVESNE